MKVERGGHYLRAVNDGARTVHIKYFDFWAPWARIKLYTSFESADMWYWCLRVLNDVASFLSYVTPIWRWHFYFIKQFLVGSFGLRL